MMKKVFRFLYITFAVLLTGYISSLLTHIGIDGWYNNVARPIFTPPNYVFPVAWSIIYVLLILATFITLQNADSVSRNKANNLFLAQLALQIIWCFAFFAQGQLALGMAAILLLDIIVYKMIVAYGEVKEMAGLLLYPYYWWLVFATFLNAIYISSFGLAIKF